MKHSFKDWVMAVRPWAFPASAIPVVVTVAYMYWLCGDINWWFGAWALVNIVVFHAAGNTWSDYFDYKHKVDAADTFGANMLTDGTFTSREIYRLSWWLITVAVLGGVALVLLTGLPLLYIGMAGAACSMCYPMMKYRAMGDLVIFISYGLLPTLGTAYIVAGYIEWSVVWTILPVGLLAVAILHANNMRDTLTDRRADIRTLAMNIGDKASAVVYCAEVVLPVVWIAALAVAGMLPVWTLLALIVALPAAANVRIAADYARNRKDKIAHLDEKTAQLQLLYGLLLSLAFVLDRLLA